MVPDGSFHPIAPAGSGKPAPHAAIALVPCLL